MRILQINNCHYRRGGADVVYFNSANLLRQNGHEVYFFSTNHSKNEPCNTSNFFIEGLDYRNLSFVNKIRSIPSFINCKAAYNKLIELIDHVKPDVAHIHLFMGGLTVSVLKALTEKNIPIVHTIHDYRLVCPAYTFLDRNNNICELCKDGFFLRCAFKRCSLERRLSHSAILALDAYYRKYFLNPLKFITHYIFVSNFSQKKHIQFANTCSLNSSVLYNFRPGAFSKSDVRGDYILFYGRLSREKGIELLVKSVTRLNCKLKIVGTGPLLNELLKQESEGIEVLGYKSGDELWNLLKNASFVVVPSEWYENNPLTIVEAFSFGKPVIGSNIGGITELLQDGRGLLFEPKNLDSLTIAIEKVLAMSDFEYKKMSNEVFNFANKHFSEEAHYGSLINIYKSVLHD